MGDFWNRPNYSLYINQEDMMDMFKKTPEQNKRLNIFLDLDNTLVHSINVNGTEEILITPRPFLEAFLTFLFDSFNVGIWTMGNKSYAALIQSKFFTSSEQSRNLVEILYKEDCFDSVIFRAPYKMSGSPKNMYYLFHHSRFNGKYNNNNTLLVDDLFDTYLSNINVIQAEYFVKENTQDDYLLRLMVKLKKIKKIYDNTNILQL